MKLFITLGVGLLCAASVAAGDRPAEAQTAYDDGLKASAAGKLPEALKLFDKAVEADPKFADAYRDRGWVYSLQHKKDAAFADLARAIKLAPKDSQNYWYRGMMRINLERDYPKAIKELTSAIELDPKNARYFNVRGFAKLQQRKYDVAILDLDEAIRLDPTFANPCQLRAECYYCLGKYEEAIKDYERAFKWEKNPGSRLYYTTGECLYQLKKYRRVIEMMTKAAELTPKDEPRPNGVDCHQYVGDSHLMLGEFKEALASYDRAMKIDPKEGDTHYRRGLALQKLNRDAEADKSFARAKELGYKP